MSDIEQNANLNWQTETLPAISLEEQRNQHLDSALSEIGKKNKRAGAFIDNSSSTAAMLDSELAATNRETGIDEPGRAIMARNYEKHNSAARMHFIMACGSCAIDSLCPYRYSYDYFEGQNHYAPQRKKFSNKLKNNPKAPCFTLPSYR
jgi:hypothetical protein